ncbi:hypothetical protein ABK040_016473 [Willaertia magna]
MKRKLQSEQSEEEESEEEKGEEGINQLVTNHNEKEKTKEPALKQLKRNIEDQQLNNNTNLFFTFVSSDCLKIILSFLNIQDLEFNLFLSKEWAKHAIPYFLEITKIEYQSKNHFNDLNLRVKNSESYSDDDSDVEFYKTQTHWAECIEYSGDEESDDEQDLRELIPFGIPLSKGSVIKQYELSEAEFTPQEYVILVKKQLRNDPEFNFFSLRSGIYKLVKKGGVMFFEPQIVADTVQLLKDYLTPIIREAYDLKFGNKEHVLEFTESKEEYDKYWENDEKNKLKDAIDSDMKLHIKDIEQAIKNVYGKSYYEEENEENKESEEDKSDEEDSNDEESEDEEEDDEEKSDEEENEYEDEYDSNSSNEESDEEDDSICSNNDIELFNSLKKHLNSNHSPFKDISIIVTVPDEDEYFINDYDFTNLITDNNFTPEQLKDDNLQNQLIKVSIRVHEEIYGKERTHNEKLYLKNWFGYGPLFYSMSASHLGNENPEELMEVEEDKKDGDFTEEEWIEKCRKQDLLYFGYSLYDDEEGEYLEIYNESNKSDEEEQASEEESKEYHLRRLLRQESMKCIEEYFSVTKNTSL